MNHKDELTFENKKIWVQGLIIECPMGKALNTCPAIDVRKLPLQERLELVRQMEESQLDEIITHHRKCLKDREAHGR
ncbi:MAG: hypothetical protein JRF52_03825 [Deltaproteobacteria bacterium]|nr:hypothetical protein [Deltaproteobacteria bacterium]